MVASLRARTWAITRRRRATGGVSIPPPAAFSPSDLFTGGENGFFCEISPSTCFTDLLRTTPAAVGDSVRAVNDSHGSGIYLRATSTGPTLRQDGSGAYYLEFTGVAANGLSSASGMDLDLSSSTGMTVAAGVRFSSVAGTQQLVSADESGRLNQTRIDGGAWQHIGFTAGGGGVFVGLHSGTPATGTDYSVIGAHDTASAILAIDGVTGTPVTNTAGTINQTTGAVRVGARNVSDNLNGRLYCAHAISRRLTSGEITSLDAYIQTLMP